ncbi:MAG: fused MFS/spermidine synthase, partial [Verrucomicrobiota bacterium]
ADYRIMTRPFDLAYYKDGAGSSVCVAEWQDEGKQQFTLRVNGKAEASTTGDVSTQLLCGHIPMLLRPQSQDVLVIGLGSGMTCSAVARHPSIQRLDVAEISPEVVEAAHYFRNHNDQLLQNPKVRVVIEDAKSFLKITDHKYDVIVSEPSNPWMAGVAAVFSREYYENCRSRLKEDGIMTQWLQAYETNEEAMNTVFATFTAVFPFMSVWQGTLGDIILIGSTQPLKVDLGALEQRFQDERVKSDLARFQLTSVVAFLSREVISQQHGQFIVPPNTPQHSDYYPTLEYLAQRALFTRRQGEAWRVFDETYSLRPTTLLADYLKSRPITEEDFLVFARMYEKEHLIPGPLMRSLIYRWQRDHPQTITTLEMLVQLDDMRQSSELEVFRLTPAREFLLKYSEKSPGLLRYYEKAMMLTYRSHRSVFFQPPARELERVIHRLLETDPANRRVYHLHLAELAWDRGDDEAFFALAEKALDPDTARGGPVNFANDPKAPGLILARMADTYFRKGQLPQALQIAVNAREQKYLEPSSTYYHPLLDMVCRKIEAATAAP